MSKKQVCMQYVSAIADKDSNFSIAKPANAKCLSIVDNVEQWKKLYIIYSYIYVK